MRRAVSVVGSALLVVVVLAGVPAPAAAEPSGALPLASSSADRPLQAQAVAVGGGRAVWLDDARSDRPLWTRDLIGTGSTTSLGPAALLTTGAFPVGLAASGRRTAFTRSDGTAAFTVAGGPAVPVDAGALWFMGQGMQLSGTRLLAQRADGTWWVNDLADGSAQAIGVTGAGVIDAHLWGDLVAFSTVDEDSTAGLWVRNLSDGSTVAVAPAIQQGVDDGSAWHRVPSGIGSHVGVWGDYMVWDERWERQVDPSCDPSTATCARVWDPVVKYRNVRTMGPVTELPVTLWQHDVAVTATRVIVVNRDYEADGSMTLRLQGAALGAQTLTTLAALPTCCDPELGDQIVIDGTQVVWLDRARLPKVVSWEADTSPPRFLGTPHPPAVVTPAVRAWDAEWVFSKPLTSCIVTISAGGAPVRNLDCSTGDGSAVVSWDGKDTAGNSVPAGTYHWTVAGGDGQGSVLNLDGSSTTINGVVNVVKTNEPAPTPPAPTPPAPTPPGAPTATAPGAPSAPVPAVVAPPLVAAIATTSTARATATTVTSGSAVTLTGRLTNPSGAGLAGATVVVQSRTSTVIAWRTIATVVTSSTGGWSTTLRPTANRTYRGVFAGTASAVAAASNAVSIAVRPRITLRVNDSDVALRTRVTFTGIVAPNHHGRTVLLQRWQGGRWVTKKSMILSSTSTFRTVWKTDSRTDFTWRVLLARHADHAAGASARRKLWVR